MDALDRMSPLRAGPLAAALALGLLATGCDRYDRPNRPFPDDIRMTTFQGEVLTAADLAGKPWVINLWVPG